MILVLNDLKPRVFYQLTTRMESGTKGRSFGLSLLLKKISCVVPILRKLETGLGSKKSRYFGHRAGLSRLTVEWQVADSISCGPE